VAVAAIAVVVVVLAVGVVLVERVEREQLSNAAVTRQGRTAILTF
jgi:hypothetical protein